jgi:hypothetical protein
MAAIAVVAAAEVIAGFVAEKSDALSSFAFPPHQTANYQTPDFRFTAITNRLGFRGPEFPVEKTPGTIRIAVLGNSFAYGWGVNYDSTWPRLLEQRFAENGIKVEVANLATPGTTPKTLIGIANRALPILHPDVVLIAALQGSSVVTFQPDQPMAERPATWRQRSMVALNWLVPNLVRAFTLAKDTVVSNSVMPASFAREAWKAEADTFIKGSSPDELTRFQQLNADTRQRFETGNLNTPIVSQAIRNPDLFGTMLTDQGQIERAASSMRDMIASVGKVAPQAKLVTVSMPYAPFLHCGAADILQRLGYIIPTAQPGQADKPIAEAAEAAGVPFVSVESEFDGKCSPSSFIPFDGHYSAEGTQLFSSLLAAKLIDIVAPQ